MNKHVFKDVTNRGRAVPVASISLLDKACASAQVDPGTIILKAIVTEQRTGPPDSGLCDQC